MGEIGDVYIRYIVEKLKGRKQLGEFGADVIKILKPNLPEIKKIGNVNWIQLA
jgi:hypothetical protein